MHISLDSAIGQQRRLNQVGETINSIAAPAAAYSLRSLTGGDPKVVRVRRESDNTERDFTASGVSSGALVDFVNTQTIKPLDTRALNSGGSGDRDGDFQIASAAYSLRSLGDRQATVSATGDTVTAADGKYVVQVRRSSDDTIKSFTADEVTDGTLVAFCGSEDITSSALQLPTTASSITLTSTTDISNYTFSINNSSGSTQFPELRKVQGFNDVVWKATGTIVVTGLSGSSGTDRLQLRTNGGDASIDTVDLVEGTNTINKTFTITGAGNFTYRIENGVTATSVVVTNLKLEQLSCDGLVRTWYDQSVTDQGGGTATGNHAVQTTAANQPKIVSSGSLVSGGLDFDGSTSRLFTTNVINSTNFAIATVAKSDDNGTAGVFAMLDNFNDGQEFLFTAGAARHQIQDSDLIVSATITNKNVYFANYDGSTQLVSINGTATTQSASKTVNVSSVSSIGFRVSADNTLNGSIEELIVYTSDQTDNRGAYEGNIADHYGITGVPTGANTVNGFVETWYDQSGNGKDAPQTTASEQPKIVSSGSLVSNGIDFAAGSTATLDMPTDLISSINSASAFFVAKSDTTGGSRVGLALSRNSPDFRFYLPFLSSSNFTFAYQDSVTKISLGSADTNKHLFTAIAGSSNAEAFLDSTSKGTVSSADGKSALTSGGIGTINSLNHWNGQIEEIIIYNSDQSANRTALETNINSHYSIF